MQKGGRSFEGAFENDLPHGHIIDTSPDGEEYVGNFVEGVRSGQGKLTLKSGKIYEGAFDDNRPNGVGSLTVPDGERFEGHFQHDGDKFTITGKVILQDGTVEVGTWGDIAVNQ